MFENNCKQKEENSKTKELNFPEGVEFRMGVDGLYEIDPFSAPRGSFSPGYDPLANRGFERHEIEAYLNKQQKPPTPMPALMTYVKEHYSERACCELLHKYIYEAIGK